jgi:hypothetical protein
MIAEKTETTADANAVIEQWDSLPEQSKLQLLPKLLNKCKGWNEVQMQRDGRAVSAWLMSLFDDVELPFFLGR